MKILNVSIFRNTYFGIKFMEDVFEVITLDRFLRIKELFVSYQPDLT